MGCISDSECNRAEYFGYEKAFVTSGVCTQVSPSLCSGGTVCTSPRWKRACLLCEDLQG